MWWIAAIAVRSRHDQETKPRPEVRKPSVTGDQLSWKPCRAAARRPFPRAPTTRRETTAAANRYSDGPSGAASATSFIDPSSIVRDSAFAETSTGMRNRTVLSLQMPPPSLQKP